MFDKMYDSIDLLQNGLSAAWTRNAVIRNNIANAETPGFKASDVEFESLLRNALNEQSGGFVGWKTHPKHRDIGSGTRKTDLSTLSSISPQVVKREGTSMLMNENNVDIDAENVKFAQNSLYYNTLLEKMNSEIRRLRMVISEAR
jgi:flagellar basal-body rod protein FlgB